MSGPTEGGSSAPAKEALIPSKSGDDAPPPPTTHETESTRLTPKQILIGDLTLAYFFMPIVLFASNVRGQLFMRFQRIHEIIPVPLGVVLSIQHATVALGQIVAPPMLFFLAFHSSFGHYTIQSAVIIAGISSLLQCLNINIPGTPYRIGTGMATFLGNSLMIGELFIEVAGRTLVRGKENSIDDAFGATLGTAALCSLLYIALACIPRKYVKPVFPPLVCGIIILLIGIDAVQTSVEYWGGGRHCLLRGGLCNSSGDVHLPFGSAEYVGLGFFALLLFLIIEMCGTAFIRRGIILFSTLIVYIIAAIIKKDGDKYVTRDHIKDAPEISFLWTTTFKLGFDKYSMIPLLVGFLAMYIQATAVLTASVEESQLDIESEEESERIQGGLLVSSVMSLFSVLATGMPVSPIPQSNSLISTSRTASNLAGIGGSICLIFFGIFAKVMGAFFVEVPICIRGAMFALLSVGIIMTAVKILSRIQWTRRAGIILLYSSIFGLTHLLEPTFFSEVLWDSPAHDNNGAQSLRIAVFFILRTPFLVGGIVAIILNLILPKEMELGVADTLPET